MPFVPVLPPVPQLSRSAVCPGVATCPTALQQRCSPRPRHLSNSTSAASFVPTSPPAQQLVSSGVCPDFATCPTALQQRRLSQFRQLSRSSSAALSHSSLEVPFVQASPPVPQLLGSAATSEAAGLQNGRPVVAQLGHPASQPPFLAHGERGPPGPRTGGSGPDLGLVETHTHVGTARSELVHRFRSVFFPSSSSPFMVLYVHRYHKAY